MIREKKDFSLETWSLYFVFITPGVFVPSSRMGPSYRKHFLTKFRLPNDFKETVLLLDGKVEGTENSPSKILNHWVKAEVKSRKIM